MLLCYTVLTMKVRLVIEADNVERQSESAFPLLAAVEKTPDDV